MRKYMLTSENEKMGGVRVRGIEVSRLEGLTDAVIGLAITLLIVSEEVPKTIDELFAMLLGFPSFAITFLLMMAIWYWHYRFFRKFGLSNNKVMWANGILLFLVLLLMFPLKYLASFVVDRVILEGWFGFDMPTNFAITVSQYNYLHMIYAAGFASVFGCFAWLYRIALTESKVLELTEDEFQSTRIHANTFLIVAIVPLLTVPLLYLPTIYAPMIAGFGNAFIWPATMIYARMASRRLDALKLAEGET